MTTRTHALETARLTAALPGATFREAHHRIVDASADACWRALHELRWRDLSVTLPLFWVRTGGRTQGTALDLGRRLVDQPGPGFPVYEEPPTYSTSAMIGRPWSGAVRGPEVTGLDQFAACAEPGWLKYGMDWTLTELGDGRTLVETSTLCQATDARSRLVFGAYWAVIRPFSGIVRADILTALARRAEGR
ncbi:hypothetical protein [Mariniluteicoccus flavus]